MSLLLKEYEKSKEGLKTKAEEDVEAKQRIDADTNYARTPLYKLYLERNPDDPYKHSNAEQSVLLAEMTQYGTGTLAVDAQQAFGEGRPVLGSVLTGLTYLSAGAPFIAKPASMVARNIGRRNKVEELLGGEGEVVDVMRTDPPDVSTTTEAIPTEPQRMESQFKQKLVEYGEVFDQSKVGDEANKTLQDRGTMFTPESLNALTGGALDESRTLDALRLIHIKNPEVATEVLAPLYSGIPEEVANLSNKRFAQLGLGKPIRTTIDNTTGEEIKKIKASDLQNYFNKITDRKAGVLDKGEVDNLVSNKLFRNKFNIKVTDSADKKSGRKILQINPEDDVLLDLEKVQEEMRSLVRAGHADYTIQRDNISKAVYNESRGLSAPNDYSDDFSRFHRELKQNQILMYPEIGYEGLTINAKSLPINALRKDKHTFRGDTLAHTRISERDMTKDTVRKVAKEVLDAKMYVTDDLAEKSVVQIDELASKLNLFRDRYDAIRNDQRTHHFTPPLLDADSLDTIKEKTMQTFFNQMMLSRATPFYDDPFTKTPIKGYFLTLNTYLKDKALASAERLTEYIPPSKYTNNHQEFIGKYGLLEVKSAKDREVLDLSPLDMIDDEVTLDPFTSKDGQIRRDKIFEDLHKNEQFQDLVRHPNYAISNDGFIGFDEPDFEFRHRDDPKNYETKLISQYSPNDPMFRGMQHLNSKKLDEIMTQYGLDEYVVRHIKDLYDTKKLKPRRQLLDEEPRYEQDPIHGEIEAISPLYDANPSSTFNETVADLLENPDGKKVFANTDKMRAYGRDFEHGVPNQEPYLSGYGVEDAEEVLDDMLEAFKEQDVKDPRIIRTSKKYRDGDTWGDKLVKFVKQFEKDHDIPITKKFLDDYRHLELRRDPEAIDSNIKSIDGTNRRSLQQQVSLIRDLSRPVSIMRMIEDANLNYAGEVDPYLDVMKYTTSRYSIMDLRPEERAIVLDRVKTVKRNMFHNKVLAKTISSIRSKFKDDNRARAFSKFEDRLKELDQQKAKKKAFFDDPTLFKKEVDKVVSRVSGDQIRLSTASEAATMSTDDVVEDFYKSPDSFINNTESVKRLMGDLKDMLMDFDETRDGFMARAFEESEINSLRQLQYTKDDALSDLALKALEFDLPKSLFQNPHRLIFDSTTSTHDKYFTDLIKNYGESNRFSSNMYRGHSIDENTKKTFEEMSEKLNIPVEKIQELMPYIGIYKRAIKNYDKANETYSQSTKDDLLKVKYTKRYTEADVDNFFNRAKEPFTNYALEGVPRVNLLTAPLNITNLPTVKLKDGLYDNVEFLSDQAPTGSNKIKFSNSGATDYIKEDIRNYLQDTNGYPLGETHSSGEPLLTRYMRSRGNTGDLVADLDNAIKPNYFTRLNAKSNTGYMDTTRLQAPSQKKYFIDNNRVRPESVVGDKDYMLDINHNLTYGELLSIEDSFKTLKEEYAQSPMHRIPRKLDELSKTGGDIDSNAYVMEEFQSDIHNEMFRESGSATIKLGETPVGEDHAAYVKRLILAAIVMAKKKGINKIIIPNYKKQKEVRPGMSQDIITRVYKKGVPKAIRELMEDSGNTIKTYKVDDLMYKSGDGSLDTVNDIADGTVVDVTDFAFDPEKGDMLRFNQGGLAA